MTAFLIACGTIDIIVGLDVGPEFLSAQWWCVVAGIGVLSYVAGRLVDAVVKTSLRGPQ